MFPKNLLLPFLWLALATIVVCLSLRVYAEFNPVDNHVWYDMRGKNLKEWKLEEHIKKEQVPVVSKPIIKPKVVEKSLPVDKEFDIVKWSKAVSKHETASCTK